MLKTRSPLHVVFKRLYVYRIHTFVVRQLRSSVTRSLIKIKPVEGAEPRETAPLPWPSTGTTV